MCRRDRLVSQGAPILPAIRGHSEEALAPEGDGRLLRRLGLGAA
jgi:hypothetical protein